jgi:hypothetical protein
LYARQGFKKAQKNSPSCRFALPNDPQRIAASFQS